MPAADSLLLEQRKKLCSLIAKLPPTGREEEVAGALDSFVNAVLKEWLRATSNGSIDEDDRVTPLMVACDKGNEGCLAYLCKRIKAAAEKSTQETSDEANKHKKCSELLLGHPLDKSSVKCGGNTALHHAAFANYAGALELLSSLLIGPTCTKKDALIQLASQRNANGDTPAMMAIPTDGHLEFLQRLVSSILESVPEDKPQQVQAEIRTLLEEPHNNDGHSILTLACGYCRVPVMDYLLSICHISTSDEDVCKCKLAVDTLVTLKQKRRLAVKGDKRALNVVLSAQERLQQCNQCLTLIKAAQEKTAESNMEKLLLAEEEEKNLPISIPKKSNKKKKRKNRTRKVEKVLLPTEEKPLTIDNYSEATPDEETPNLSVSESIANAWEPTHHDCADKNSDNNESSNENEPLGTKPQSATVIHDRGSNAPILATIGTNKERTIDVLLRDAVSTALPVQEQPDKEELPVDSMMEALCLDASMLLLSAHGMAMNLSPSQLDVVQVVLERQQAALQTARDIQARLLQKNAHHTS